MFLERVHTSDMIRVQMRENDLTHAAAFARHFVDTLSQRLLLVFVRRSGIEDEHLFRVVNDVTARVSRGRPRRRAYGKADVIRPEGNASRRFAIRVRYRQKSFHEIGSDAGAESPQRMQRRRHSYDLIVHPSIVSFTRPQPLTTFE